MPLPFSLRHDSVLPIVLIELAAVLERFDRVRPNLCEFSPAQVAARRRARGRKRSRERAVGCVARRLCRRGIGTLRRMRCRR